MCIQRSPCLTVSSGVFDWCGRGWSFQQYLQHHSLEDLYSVCREQELLGQLSPTHGFIGSCLKLTASLESTPCPKWTPLLESTP